jgi:hypothetical protein
MAFNYSPKIVTDGLVLYLDAANQYSYVSGSTSWNDISRGGNNGTLINGPTYNSANGGSILCDGVNDYIDCGNSSTVTQSGNNKLTIDIWVKIVASNKEALVGAANQSTFRGWGLQWIGDVLYFILRTGNAAQYNYASIMYQNNFFNFIGVYDGTEITSINKGKIYVNGVNQIVTNGGGALPTSLDSNLPNFLIGNIINYGGYSNAYFGTIKIYNRALSSTEVLQNYNATKTRFGL